MRAATTAFIVLLAAGLAGAGALLAQSGWPVNFWQVDAWLTPMRLGLAGSAFSAALGAAGTVLSLAAKPPATEENLSSTEKRLNFEADQRHGEAKEKLESVSSRIDAVHQLLEELKLAPQTGDDVPDTPLEAIQRQAVKDVVESQDPIDASARSAAAAGDVPGIVRALLEAARVVRADSADRYRKAAALASAFDSQTAKEAYEAAVTLDPLDVWSRIFLSRLYASTNVARARELAHEAISLSDDPRDRQCALNTLGDTFLEEGNSAGAREVFLESEKLCKQLIQSEQQNGRYIHDYSIVKERLGEVYGDLGDLNESIYHYRDGFEQILSLHNLHPKDSEIALLVGTIGYKFARALVTSGQLPEAREILETCVKTYNPNAPDDRFIAERMRVASIFYENLAVIDEYEGKTGEQKLHLDKSLAIRSALADIDKLNDEYQILLLAAYSALGRYFISQGDEGNANRELSTLVKKSRELSSRHGPTYRLQFGLSSALQQLSTAKNMAGLTDEAKALLEESKSILNNLIKTTGRTPELIHSLSVVESRLGDNANRAGDREKSTLHYQADLSLARELCGIDPRNIEWKKDLTITLSRLGISSAQVGDFETAANYWEEEIEILYAIIKLSPKNADIAARLVTAHVHMASLRRVDRARHVQAALEIFKKIDGTPFLPPNIAKFLSEASSAQGASSVAAGYRPRT